MVDCHKLQRPVHWHLVNGSMGFYTSQWITRPIFNLSQASEAIVDGKLNRQVKEDFKVKGEAKKILVVDDRWENRSVIIDIIAIAIAALIVI